MMEFMTQNPTITCPQCGFSRQVPADRMPAGAMIATCPKCACRFRITSNGGTGEILQPKNSSGTAQPEEEDIRLTASRAYQREADRFANEEYMTASQNPWDNAPGESGWFAAFFQTVVRVMFSTVNFFSSLSPSASQLRPLAFYLLIGAFQTIVEKLWGQMFYALLEPAAASDPQLQKMLAMLASDSNMALSLLLRCGLLALQIYFFSFMIYFIYKIIRPQTASFSLVFHIMAYSAVPSLLCVVPVLGSITGLVWGIGCMAAGFRAAMRLTWAQTLLGFLPVFIFVAPIIPQLLNIMK